MILPAIYPHHKIKFKLNLAIQVAGGLLGEPTLNLAIL